jgi:selenocysteine lyase/cysteine desulfurase
LFFEHYFVKLSLTGGSADLETLNYNDMDRRKFLGSSGFAISAAALMPFLKTDAMAAPGTDTWTNFRNLFRLDPAYIHMTQMLLASHPKPVRDAIENHRKLLDENPTEYWENNFIQFERRVAASAAKYLEVDQEEVMLTDSTTMGLGLLYTGLKLTANDEILTTTHDHYSTEKSLEYAALKNNAKIKRISLYSDPSKVSKDQIVNAIAKSISDATRVVAVTWVHSSTGVKLPISEIAAVIKEANTKRNSDKRIYFCVDGVHGFGVDDITMKGMGCDFFVAGTHKWIFGPRGTGIVYGKRDAWDFLNPTIPAFSELSYGMWMGMLPEGKIHFSDLQTPGGFHSFEHRWSLGEAFELHMTTGKANIMQRNQQLSERLKNGLKEMKHVKLHTPLDKGLSAAINCFEIDGVKPDDVLKKLHQKKIISSTTPYRVHYNRLTPCVINTEQEIDQCLAAVAALKTT